MAIYNQLTHADSRLVTALMGMCALGVAAVHATCEEEAVEKEKQLEVLYFTTVTL